MITKIKKHGTYVLIIPSILKNGQVDKQTEKENVKLYEELFNVTIEATISFPGITQFQFIEVE